MKHAPFWPACRRPADPSADTEMSGCLPLTFEPEETLGDTGPMPLDPLTAARIERTANRLMYAAIAVSALLYFAGLL